MASARCVLCENVERHQTGTVPAGWRQVGSSDYGARRVLICRSCLADMRTVQAG
jgi:hypothetical protein